MPIHRCRLSQLQGRQMINLRVYLLPWQRSYLLEQQEATYYQIVQHRRRIQGTSVVIATCEVVWLRRILKDLSVPIKDLIPLYCDNVSNIHLVQNLVSHVRTKHIEVLSLYPRARSSWRCQLATHQDEPSGRHIFTKALGVNKLRQFMSNLGLTTTALPSLKGSTTTNKHNATTK